MKMHFFSLLTVKVMSEIVKFFSNLKNYPKRIPNTIPNVTKQYRKFVIVRDALQDVEAPVPLFPSSASLLGFET